MGLLEPKLRNPKFNAKLNLLLYTQVEGPVVGAVRAVNNRA